ncbi:MAG: 2-amino-4-hydroxy-6-hydroxymethyldihydropteridine diphosphokinase, partial [Solirubrobacteraceae bacterium]
MTATGYLGLGSNIGDTRAHLAAAIAALPQHGVRVRACSSLYETEPVGLVLDQPDFLNACVRIETELGPEALLDACKAVEREVGRAAGGP